MLKAAGLAPSTSEATRKLSERAVRVDGEVIESRELLLQPGGEHLLQLGKRGFQRIGFDSEGATAFDEITLQRPLVMVMGAEGKGLRQRSRELCDHLARLEVPGAITSLNVSNATAIALYAASRRR